jgi:hypothetical protein
MANFEVASRDHIINAFSRLSKLEELHIRVYLESRRRSSEFSAKLPYFDFDAELCSKFMLNWPNLKAFTVTHCPETAYHSEILDIAFACLTRLVVRPDPVLSPALLPLIPHRNRLTILKLRETMIDDAGLLHLIGRNQLRSLSLMSCQGAHQNGCFLSSLT